MHMELEQYDAQHFSADISVLKAKQGLQARRLCTMLVQTMR